MQVALLAILKPTSTFQRFLRLLPGFGLVHKLCMTRRPQEEELAELMCTSGEHISVTHCYLATLFEKACI